VLRPAPNLFTSYNVPISSHLVHGHATFLVSLGGLNLPFVVQTTTFTFLGCWALILLALISLFPIGQSPYYSKYSTTCWDRHFPILHKTKRCLSHITLSCSLSGPTLWKPNGLVLSLIASFFGGLLTWTKVYFVSNRCSFEYCVSMSPLMCRSRGKCLVISSFYHTSISFIINSFSYNIMYPSWIATSYSCPLFTMLVWLYHWQSRYPFVSMPLREWTYNSPWHTLGYYYSYCFGEWSTCWKGSFPFFPLPHLTNGYFYH
jgi:hypothetical protein